MKKGRLVYLGFFLLLFAGYFLYVFTQTDISQSNLPVINNYVSPFSFVDQNGNPITEKDVEGKVYVVEYFFTTCKGICPKMNANMRRVFDEFKADSNFLIISHTCMPETDSVPVLKKYEQKMLTGKLFQLEDKSYKLDTSAAVAQPLPSNHNWYFVTGEKAQLYGLARHGYLVDNNKTDSLTKIDEQFIHTQFFALLDKQTRVRGIYDGLKEDEIQKLLKDIKALLKENQQNRSLK